MSVMIDKIIFENYRQYGSLTLRFLPSNTGMLSVLIAKNGTGKTTLLNAITWCLYGREHHLANKNAALPIVNTSLTKLSEMGDSLPVSVSVSIIDEKDVVEFKRALHYKVVRDENGSATAVPGTQTFTVSITSIDGYKNTKIKQGADAEMVVKQYFDEAIFGFYFFDGEKLGDYFAPDQSANIRSSIFNISQVTLLENACVRLKKIQGERMRKLGKGSPNIKDLQDKKDEQTNIRTTAENSLNTSKTALSKRKEELTKLNNTLSAFGPIKSLQQERTSLEAALKDIDGEDKSWHTRRTEFIRKYITLLGLYPGIKHTLNIIKQKEADGDLPPAIDKSQVKTLLDHLDEPCPLCHGEIGETGRQHLEGLLSKISVSSQTSNYLKEIKGSLETYCEEVALYKQERQQLQQEGIDIEERKKKVCDRLAEINGILSKYESGEEHIDVARIEARRSELNDQIETLNRTIGAAERTLQNCRDEIDRIDKELEGATKKIQEHDDIKAELAVIKNMYSRLNEIKEHIMSVMRKEIEQTTWEFFDSMIWKKNTFGKVTISENYEVSVFNKEGSKMTGSLSATEQMALAYAFTLAIHKASGKNCPLVIDSPLGRVSDKNRENMARALGEISKDKQIIMLFTPDEYSESVQKIYDKIAEVRNFNLSDDESHIEGIED